MYLKTGDHEEISIYLTEIRGGPPKPTVSGAAISMTFPQLCCTTNRSTKEKEGTERGQCKMAGKPKAPVFIAK